MSVEPVAEETPCRHIYLPAGPHEDRDLCVAHNRAWPCPDRNWQGVRMPWASR